MNHLLCFNHHSVDTTLGTERSYELMYSALQGALNINTGNDIYSLYAYMDDFGSYNIGHGYSVNDFKSDLIQRNERDLLLFLNKAEERYPFLGDVGEDIFEDAGELTISIHGRAHEDYTIFAVGWIVDGIMLSMASDESWSHINIRIGVINSEDFRQFQYTVRNIAAPEHGEVHRNPILRPLETICPTALFTQVFQDWDAGLQPEVRGLIRDKLSIAQNFDFTLGRPLVDTLNGSKHHNMKELRVQQWRICFARTPNRVAAVLNGFLKHGHDDEYDRAITQADILYDAILNQN